VFYNPTFSTHLLLRSAKPLTADLRFVVRGGPLGHQIRYSARGAGRGGVAMAWYHGTVMYHGTVHLFQAIKWRLNHEKWRLYNEKFGFELEN